MAIYQIKCTHCEWEGEAWCKWEDLPEQQCQVCSSLVERLFTGNSTGATAVKLTGNGWYIHNTH